MFVAVGVGIHFPARIISSSEFLHFLLRCISPGMISLFFSGKCNQFDGSVLCEISSLQIVRVEVYWSPVDISVRTDVGKTGVKSPVVVQQSSSYFHRFLVRIERTVRAVELGIRFHCRTFRLHIDAGSECTCPIGGRSCTALHLHILYGRRKVRHIYPKQIMAFGVIHRYPVHGDVDACTIGSAYTEGCVTDTGSRIRCGQGRRSHAQQVRNILSEVYFFKFCFSYIGECHRCFCCGTCRYYLHFLQVNYFQTVGFCTRSCMDSNAYAQ